MADDKWISGLSGNMPVAAAAWRVLTVRLGVVLDRLPPAVEHADEDVEHVHQLRVGTRRAGAAVRIFADCLPVKLHKRMRRTLRAIRRAAGAARDWDVFLEALAERSARAKAPERPGIDFLLGFGHGQRVCAQGYLCAATDGAAEQLQKLVADCAEAAENANRDVTLRSLAVPRLTELVHELEEAAHGDLSRYEALHQVRILGKQLRYAMELFESCFAPAFRDEMHPEICTMQDILGRANDSHVASQRLEELQARLARTQPDAVEHYRPAIARLQSYHRRRLSEQRRHFVKWWKTWESSGHAAALVGLVRAED
jgi:CHAD domain-containing protein